MDFYLWSISQDPVDPLTYPVVISPVSECILRVDILNSWENPHISSLTYGRGAIVLGKTKWKPLELFLPRKIVSQKQQCIPGGVVQISATIKNLKDTEIVIPVTSPFSLPLWPYRKQMEFWRRTVDHCKFNQVVTPVAATVQYVWFHCWSKNTTSPGISAICLANAFSLFCFHLERPAINLYCPTSGIYQLSRTML